MFHGAGLLTDHDHGNIHLMHPKLNDEKPCCFHRFPGSITAILFLVIGATNAQTTFAWQANSPGEIEEVIVYGEKSLLSLKREVMKAEENAYAVFNSLNTDHQYDIRCYKKAPTGSHIKRRVCFPNYMHDLEEEAASIWGPRQKMNRLVEGMIGVDTVKMKQKRKNLRDIMDALAIENPQLANALRAYSEAKHIYVTESKKRCPRLFFNCQE